VAYNAYRYYLEGSPNLDRLDPEKKTENILRYLGYAALGVGAIALGARAGLFDWLSSAVSRYGRAGVEALVRYQELRRPGLPRSLAEEWKLFRGQYEGALRRTEQYRPSKLEELIQQRTRILVEELPFQWQEAFRYADIWRVVQSEMQNQAALRLIARIRPGVLRNLNYYELARIAERERVALPQEDLRKLFDIIGRHQHTEYELGEFGRRVQEQTVAFLDEQIREIMKARRGMQWLTGRRPATVEEILRAVEAKRFTVPEETYKLLLGLRRTWGEALKETIFDPHIMITETGRIVDWRGLREFRLGVMRWLEPTLPGRLMHLRDFLEMGQAPPFYVLQRGTLHPFLTGRPGTEAVLEQSYLVAGKKIVPVTAPDRPLPREFELIPAKFGLTERLIRSIADIGVTELPGQKWYDRGFWSRARQFLDIGYSTSPSIQQRLRSIFTKFRNEEWYRNVIEGALRGYKFDEKTVELLRNYFNVTTPAPSRRAMRVFLEAAGRGGFQLDTYEDALALLHYVGQAPSRIQSLWYRARRDSEALRKEVFLLSGRPSKRVLTGEDIIYREVAKELSLRAGYDKARQALDEALQAGRITKQEHLEALQIVNASMFEEATRYFDTEELRGEAVELARRLFGEGRFREEVRQWVRRGYPLWSFGPREAISLEEVMDVGTAGEFARFGFATLGQRYTPITTSPGLIEAVKAIKNQNDWTKLRAVVKQWTAGRGNLEEVTFNTIRPLSPYHLMWRLSEGLQELGLGFSGRSYSSVLDLYLSFAFKRFLPVVAGIEALRYIDWESDQLTGLSFSERWMNTVVRTRLMLAPADASHWKHIYSMFPYLEQVAYWPHPSFPVIGMAFSYPLFGIPPWEPRSKEELREYYATGYQEIRKGRFWFFGS